MNVTFHVLTGISVAAVLCPRKQEVTGKALLVGLGATIPLHGLLDFVPHSYPIKSSFDVIVALLLFGTALLLAKPHLYLLIATCFVGSVLPDLVDLTPGILHRHVGLSLPEARIFPWHWRQYSGSIYNGSRGIESAAFHLLVVATATFSLWWRRDRFTKLPRSAGWAPIGSRSQKH